jgi:hypothetical protein
MSKYNGLDDLLAANLKPRRLRREEVADFFRRRRAELFGAPEETSLVPAPNPPADDRPPFPLDVFPTRVADFARRVATAMGCPVDYPATAVLVVSGAAVGAARALELKGGWPEQAAMYAVIVGAPGRVKTPPLRAVMAPIYEEQDRLHENYRAARKHYARDKEAYKAALRHKGEEEPRPPVEPPPMRHLFTSDTTVEELGNNLQENRKGLLLFRDELTAWVRSMDQYRGRGADRQFFLSAWSGEMVKVDRRGRHGEPIIVPNPFVSVLGSIQPDMLAELEAEGGREDGFTHRILFSYPPEPPVTGWTDDEVGEEDQLAWRTILGQLLKLEPTRPEGASERPRRLQFSPGGRAAFKEWCNRQAAEMNGDDFPPELLGPGSKMRAYCARFALVIHLLRYACGEAGHDQDEGQVDAEDVRRAGRLCAYFLGHARAVYRRLRETVEDRSVDEFLHWLRRRQLGRCTVRELCRSNVAGVKTASAAEALLKAAIDRGLGDWEGAGSAAGKRGTAFVLSGAGCLVTSPDKPDTRRADAASTS